MSRASDSASVVVNLDEISLLNSSQVDLVQAMENSDLQKFEEALNKNADPTVIYKKGFSILETLCSTVGAEKYIRLCEKYKGTSILTTKNAELNIYPIHLAIKSCDYNNVIVIMQSVGINHIYDDKFLTTLHIFFDLMENFNYDKIFECFKKVLLSHKMENLNINTTSENGDQPIYRALKNNNLKRKKRYDLARFVMSLKIDIELNEKSKKEIEDNYQDIKIPKTIDRACYIGDKDLVKQELDDLDACDLDCVPAISIVIKRLCAVQDKTIQNNLKECLEILFNDDYIQINTMDNNYNTALYYAVQLRNEEYISTILQKHPHLEVSHSEIFYIKNMDPKLLENYFDSCITKHKQYDDNFKINFNFKSFNPQHSYLGKDELHLFTSMSKTQELRNLLLHPLCTSFIYLKWRPLNPLFYFSFLITLFYYTTYIVFFTFSDIRDDTPYLPLPLWIVLVFCYILMLINCFLRAQKFNILPVIILYPRHNCYAFEYSIYTFYILLAAAQIMYSMKGIRFFSITKYIYLFVTVLRNFLEIIVFYGIIVVLFAFAFFKNFYEYNKKEFADNNDTATTDGSEDEDPDEIEANKFQNFYTISMAIMKTFIMSTGEIDAAKYNYTENPLIYYLLIIFIISITIVLSNLLTGFAVNDVEDILKDAKLRDEIQRIEILAQYDKTTHFLTKRFEWISRLKCMRNFVQLFNSCIIDDKITVYPQKPDKYVMSGDGDEWESVILTNHKRLGCLSNGEFENIIESAIEIDKKNQLKAQEKANNQELEKNFKQAQHDVMEAVSTKLDDVLGVDRKKQKKMVLSTITADDES